MNLVTTRSPNFGSGLISRLSARWRRDILFVSHLRGPAPQTKSAEAGKPLLRTLGAVFGAALLAVLHALRVKDAADDVITYAGKVLHAAAADHHHGVFLKVVALARNVADHLEAVGQADLRHLAQRRVRLLRRRRVDARAHAPLLRVLLHRGNLVALHRRYARLADQLVYGRHSPSSWSKTRVSSLQGSSASTNSIRKFGHQTALLRSCPNKSRGSGNRLLRAGDVVAR